MPAVPGRRQPRRRRRRSFGCARRTSTTRSAASASARSPSSRASSRTASDLPFAFEEHGSYGRPTLYEYRPLVRGFVEARAERLFARVDVQDAVADLLREPAARIFAHAHEGDVRDERRAVYRSVLVPLLVRTAEGCGGFDWDDTAFARAYEELEASLFGEGHAYGAVAPLDRALRRHADRARRRDPRARGRHGRARGDVAGGGGPAAAGLRPRAGPDLRARARALAPGRGGRGARRAGRARRRGHRDPARDRGAGRRRACPLRAARLAAVRDPARPPDRGDGASRRADAARPVPRLGRERRARAARRRRRRPAASATRSTAGSWRSSSPSRSAASSFATRSRPRSARATGPGRPPCAAPRCSARRRRSAPTSRRACGSRAASCCAACSSPSSSTATVAALVRELDEALLGAGPGASLQQRAS